MTINLMPLSRSEALRLADEIVLDLLRSGEIEASASELMQAALRTRQRLANQIMEAHEPLDRALLEHLECRG